MGNVMFLKPSNSKKILMEIKKYQRQKDRHSRNVTIINPFFLSHYALQRKNWNEILNLTDG